MQVFLFPGQGSQSRGMGGALFDEVREFVELEKQIDDVLGYSIRRLCLEDPDNQLGQTQYTQVALYVVNALHYYKELASAGKPRFFAGHSLGEYNALLAGGAFDFLTGLRLVQKRGELMGQARNGSMAAVVGLSPETIKTGLMENELNGIDFANYNSYEQLVISGPEAQIKAAGPILEQLGAKLYLQLSVSAAFHSRYMKDAAAAFEQFLAPIDFQPITERVLSNVTGALYPQGEASASAKSLLVQQIASPVQWTQGIRYLIARGASEFKEVGPGNVLTRLVQQIRSA
ncbi:ACP S-malonyltransferase [Trinickia sp. NRRL B-1857]|uniref:ACP S-malonyltransferase n=1 Tax=Trinickia sp. NRRL B-1857 TaxID=3162879 RepID=UPI003D26C469